jgi:hypothetical protein
MKISSLIIILVLGNFVFSQSKGEVVIFSNLGDHFFVLINGERQNQEAATNVKVKEVLPGFYSCKVISQNNLYVLNTNLEIKAGVRVTFRIIEKKGKVKLRYFTEQSLETNPQPNPGQCVIVYGQPPAELTPVSQQTETTTVQTNTQTNNTNNGTQTNPINSNENINMSGTGFSNDGSGGFNQQVGSPNGSTTQTTVQTTTQTDDTNFDENVTISINMSETGFSTNISTNGANTSQIGTISGTNATTTTTTTTTSSSSSSSNNTNNGTTDQPRPIQSGNCIIDAAGMSKAIEMIKAESFAEDKMGVAKQFTRSKCLTVNQVKEIALLFDFSEDKMEYVKFAHDYCMNPSDYYLVSDVFTFSDDKDEFNGFLDTK